MPELPDICLYIDGLERRIVGQSLERSRLLNPFVLRTVDPPLDDCAGKTVQELRRLGKRIAIGLSSDLWIVIHLMIAGRLHWKVRDTRGAGKTGLAAFDFPAGSLLLTEAGSTRRATLHVVRGHAQLAAHDPAGLEVLSATRDQFATVLCRENHTLKRSLTDPHLFSGIGNAYSDEILHRARLSPVSLSAKLTDEQIDRLFRATQEVLNEWIERLKSQTGEKFPEKVTAFRPEMAVHGRFGLPCPVCGVAVQRIRYAENETNYCPQCQTGGRVLADRSLSRLLKQDWPRTVEELEYRQSRPQ